MNPTQLFDYNGAAVRVVGDADEPLFVAVDVCRALGIKNPSDTLLKVIPENERSIEQIYTSSGTSGTEQAREVLVLKESGLYRLIFRSDKPAARLFQDWVFKEVLPSIRRNKGYVLHGFDLNEAYRLARTGAAQIEVLKLLQGHFEEPRRLMGAVKAERSAGEAVVWKV